ncbi:hypothetical protein B0T14DRAFT_572988 [Immersiella caudata]|uniref:Uncharacterized protein n=1 Tax=Immersiella caudata TaxID=314043 RepID=A0AA39XD49_9PEZI|nr:hypothetical protein B0T14DRAFT_572988 [Immersiella caudata]
MGFQQYCHTRFTYETADPDDTDFDSGFYSGSSSGSKTETQYPPIRPDKPYPSFAERWNEKHVPRYGVNRDFILSGNGPLPEQINPDPTIYQFTGLDARRRQMIELLGFDQPALIPAADPSGVETRNLDDLQTGEGGAGQTPKWRPVKLDIRKQWPIGKELDSHWYKSVWVELFIRVRHFAKKYFEFEGSAYSDFLPEWEGGKLWKEAGLGEVFLHYAQLVARQDNKDGGWEGLLGEKERRTALVVAVISRVLQTEVFDEYLFGASTTARKMFKAQDSATITTEGYSRTETRANCVRLILGQNTLTENFWEHVDSLAFQMTEMLLPLLILTDRKIGDESQANSLRAMHQELHHIVAEAGYLSIGIRRSRDIFRFNWPVPGQPWELDHDNTDEENTIFNRSKEASESVDKEAKKVWEARKEEEATGVNIPDAYHRPSIWDWLLLSRSHAGAPAQERYVVPSYLAKVHIVLHPTLQRLSTASEDGRSQHYTVATGEAVDLILKAQVVYYHGRAEDKFDALEGEPSLATWAETRRPVKTLTKALTKFTSTLALSFLRGLFWVWDRGSSISVLLLSLIALVLAWHAFKTLSDDFVRTIESVKQFVTDWAKEVAVFILTAIIYLLRALTFCINCTFLAARLVRLFLIWLIWLCRGAIFTQEGRDAAGAGLPIITWDASQAQTYTYAR